MIQIIDFPNYFIDHEGNCYSNRKNGTLVKLAKRKCKLGYVHYSLSNNFNKCKYHSAHRLVAIYYVINPFNKKCVNHKNGNRSDNRAENLEWCTQSENVKHGFECNNRIPTTRKVDLETLSLIKKDLSVNLKYGDCKRISEKYNIPYKIILNIKQNKYYKQF